jgi:pimeloyl-ACP methyl ester carboxylesterase
MHRELAGSVLEHQRLVTHGIIAGGLHVGIRARPPDTERVTIPNASHGMHRMNPAAFNSSVAQFLSKH